MGLQGIIAIHGVADMVIDNSLMSHRNFINQKKYICFLEKYKGEIVDLKSALVGQGMAITIDDATDASISAAIIAAEMGIPSTIFVNPSNIVNQSTYWFNTLSFLLDNYFEELDISNIPDNLADYTSKQAVRKILKNALKSKKNNFEIGEALSVFFPRIDIDSIEIPEFLKTVSISRFLEYRNHKMINIQNHLWEHIDANSMNEDSLIESITKTNEWIEASTSSSPIYLAPPFGEIIPNYQYETSHFKYCFLLDSRLNHGFIGKKYYNRLGLNDKKIKPLLQ